MARWTYRAKYYKESRRPLAVREFIDRIREEADIPAGRLPTDLLNLKYLGQAPPAPPYLNLRRFDVRPAISSRLERSLPGPRHDGRGQGSPAGPLLDLSAIRSARFFCRIQRR